MPGTNDRADEPGSLRATFHYTDGERETRANLLIQHLQSGEQVVVLQGDPGSGRTHILRRLLARSDHGLHIYAVHAEPGLTVTDLLLGLLEHLQLPPPPSEAPDRIRAHATERLAAMARGGERPVLALDDADLLDDDVIESLLAIRDDTRDDGTPPLGLLLVGSPRLALRIADMAGMDHGRTPVSVALHGLDRAGTRAFLMEALKADGDSNGHLLETLDVDAIVAASGGHPGTILEEARRQLSGETASRPAARPRRGRGLAGGMLPAGSRRSVGLVSAATVVLIGTLLALTWVFEDEAGDTTESIERDEITAADDPVASEDAERVTGNADARAVDQSSLTPEGDGDGLAAIDGPETFDFTDAGSDDEAVADTEDATAEEPSEASADEPVEPSTEPEQAESDDTELARPADDTPDAEPRPGDDRESDEEPETDPEPASALERALAAGRDWRDQQAAEAWTVQLVGGHNAESVLRWMDTHADQAELHLLRTRRDGRDWFIVVTGAEADRETAQERRDALPEPLRDAGAWIRQLQGVGDA